MKRKSRKRKPRQPPSSVNEALGAVLKLHREGQFAEARLARALAAVPSDYADALNLLGFLFHRLGNTNESLDRDVIRCWANTHPEADCRSIIKAFYLCLPPATYRVSCVFHSANGCNLPISMRSFFCLNTSCGGVVELRLLIEGDGESRFFLAASNKNMMVRGSFEDCQGDGIGNPGAAVAFIYNRTLRNTAQSVGSVKRTTGR